MTPMEVPISAWPPEIEGPAPQRALLEAVAVDLIPVSAGILQQQSCHGMALPETIEATIQYQ